MRRPGHAAGDGRVRLRDGRAARRSLQGTRDHRHRSRAVPLPGVPADGALRGQATAPEGRRTAPDPEAGRRHRVELAPGLSAGGAGHDADAGLHAVPVGVLGHRAVLRLLVHPADRAPLRQPSAPRRNADVETTDRRAVRRRQVCAGDRRGVRVRRTHPRHADAVRPGLQVLGRSGRAGGIGVGPVSRDRSVQPVHRRPADRCSSG